MKFEVRVRQLTCQHYLKKFLVFELEVGGIVEYYRLLCLYEVSKP